MRPIERPQPYPCLPTAEWSGGTIPSGQARVTVRGVRDATPCPEPRAPDPVDDAEVQRLIIPTTRDSRNRITKITTSSLAISTAPAAIFPKPKTAATMAMMKKTADQNSIRTSSSSDGAGTSPDGNPGHRQTSCNRGYAPE